MRSSPLKPGDLIRYQATTSRWHLGVVRRVEEDRIEVEFFWGASETVPSDRVKRFHECLDERERVLSLKRTTLCDVFFGEQLERLHRERLRKVQKTLRQFGLSFSPEHWPTPTTRVQIWRDESVILGLHFP